MKVLISPSFGAGWSTWEGVHLAIDKDLIAAFERGCGEEEMRQLCIKKGYGDVYMGGFSGLTIEEVPKGCYFKVREYDGAEYIEIFNPSDWIKAED